MGGTDRGDAVLRVERGTATEEELAALTVVLLALLGRPADTGARPLPAGGAHWWRRPGRPSWTAQAGREEHPAPFGRAVSNARPPPQGR
ncbi:acyl-CoA carboxylase epsilon subunit [Streptomyces sp. NPDC054766]